MAIRPISPISYAYANRYSNVNFESRRNKRNSEESFSDPIRQKLAVPLAATIIAINSLSASAKPLNEIEINEPNRIEMVDGMQQASEKVFASKTFAKEYDPALGSYTPQVKLINTKGGPGFDKIKYSLIMHNRNNYNSYLADVIGVNNSKLTIIGDDGVKGHTITSKSLKTRGGVSNELAVKPEQIKYIEDAINSPNNHGEAKIYNYNKGIRMTYGELQNVPNGDIMKNAQPMISSFGKLCAEGVLTGDKSEYKLRIYSPDGSDAAADDMTLQKDGYPELQVRGIFKDVVTINPEMENQQKYEYGKVLLVGKDKNGKRQMYFIQDDILTTKIARFFAQNNVDILKQVVDIKEVEAKYLVEDGMILPIIE